MKIVATPIPPGSHLIRVLIGDGPAYDRMIVVTEAGEDLHLMGWVGTPLTPQQWRAGAAQWFGQAKRVCFERWCGRRRVFRAGFVRLHTVD